MGAAITGWGTALPDGVLDNAELAGRFGVTEGWIEERTGISSRRVVGDGDTTSTLATAAGAEALKRAHVGADEIDLVILATCTPDFRIPASAPLVQDALGASNAGAIDVNAVCAGFVYALAQASAMVDSGVAGKVLVVGADVFTTVTDYDDIGSAILFGDGAGAVLVEDVPGPGRLGPYHFKADGSTTPLLYIPEGEEQVQMHGRQIYRYAVEAMSSSVKTLLTKAGLSIGDVDLLVAHQANARILKAVGERLEMPVEKVVLNMGRLGNTSAASIPLALADAAEDGRLKPGARVALTAIGGGLVWGSALIVWGTGSGSRGNDV